MITFDFNDGVLPLGWSSSPYTVGQPCNSARGNTPSNTNYFWANTLQNGGPCHGKRFVQTAAFNAVELYNVNFIIRYGADDPSPGCENPESIDEAVLLQYSIDDGVTWVDFGPNLEPDDMKEAAWYNWYNVSIDIPQQGRTANTIIRWFQPSNDGLGYDNWGLDDIVISNPAVILTTPPDLTVTVEEGKCEILKGDIGEATATAAPGKTIIYLDHDRYSIPYRVGVNVARWTAIDSDFQSVSATQLITVLPNGANYCDAADASAAITSSISQFNNLLKRFLEFHAVRISGEEIVIKAANAKGLITFTDKAKRNNIYQKAELQTVFKDGEYITINGVRAPIEHVTSNGKEGAIEVLTTNLTPSDAALFFMVGAQVFDA